MTDATPTTAQTPEKSPDHATPDRPASDLAFAAAILRDEADALRAAADALSDDFTKALELIEHAADAGGTVLVSGLGKSGLIGAKIAATLSSVGITAHAVHPTEAAHGDLGRFRKHDIAIGISHSGETEEVVALCATLRQDGLPVIAITKGTPDRSTSLERLADAVLADSVTAEAGTSNTGDTPDHHALVAPSSSTTAAMALGDALALTLARRARFGNDDFAKRHPGGQLGGLLRPIGELLRFRAGENLPLIEPTETVAAALDHASQLERRPGAILIVEPGTGRLAGIFTDGDLRRLVRRDRAALDRPIEQVMTPAPRTLPITAIARDAVNMVREHRQDEIPVTDPDTGKPLGLLDVQDLIAMRLIRA